MTHSRDELLSALNEQREQMELLLATLNETQLMSPDFSGGGWSLKDVLSHMTAWVVDMLTNLGKLRRGQKPGRLGWNSADIQAQNSKWREQYKQRPLELVLADFDGVRQQTLRVVEQMSDAELAKPLKGLAGVTLADYVADRALDHEAEHLAELRAWLASQPRNDSIEGQVSSNGSHGAA